jgi:hypothetical protein
MELVSTVPVWISYGFWNAVVFTRVCQITTSNSHRYHVIALLGESELMNAFHY